jgi:hypothetical protein
MSELLEYVVSLRGAEQAAAQAKLVADAVKTSSAEAAGFGQKMSAGAGMAAMGIGRSTTTIRGHLASLKSDMGAAGGGVSGAASVAFGGMASAAASAEGRIGASFAKIRSHLTLGSSAKSVGSELGKVASTAEMAGASSGVGPLMAGAAVIAAATATAAFAKNAVEATQQTLIAAQAMHAVTGMSTQDAVAWSIATSAYGVNAKAMGMSLKLLATQAVAAEGGSKASIATFKSMGISVGDLRKTGGNLNSMYQLMINHLNAMPGGAQKTADAAKLLGRNWQALLPLLSQGGKGISQVTDLMHKFGLTTSGNAVKDMDKFHQAQIKMKEAWTVLQMVIAEKLVPVLIKLMPKILDVAHAVGVGLSAAFHFVGGAIKDVNGWLDKHKTLMNGVKGVITTVAGFVAGALTLAWKGFTTVMSTLVGIIGGMLSVWKTVIGILTPVANFIGGALTTAFNGLKTVIGALLTPIGLVVQGLQAIFGAGGGGTAGSNLSSGAATALLHGVSPQLNTSGTGYSASHPYGGATGAIVTRPTRAIIGEKGPEALIPLSSAPGASAIGGGFGSGDIILHLDGREVARATRRQILEAMARGQ